MKKYRWGRSSKRRLKRLCDDGVRVMNRALSYGIIDFAIICTVRGKTDQNNAYNAKPQASKLKWPHGKHNVFRYYEKSKAVDAAPVINGKISWDESQCMLLTGIILAAAKEENVDATSGANWDRDGEFLTDQDFDDICHTQFM